MDAAQRMSGRTLGHFIEAARPRTLPAAFAPVLVGTAAAARQIADLDVLRFGLALLVAFALQVAVNFANDLFDGVKGVDTAERTGPRRSVASGLISAAAMRNAMIVTLAVAALAGLLLASMVGWELVLVGLAAIAAALGYSGGARPYASRGFGELSVFIFFGVIATVGSQYVQDEGIGQTAVLASLPIGLIAVALLVVNNLRDIPQDRAVGKRTLVVRLGEQRTRQLFAALLLGAAMLTVPVALSVDSAWPLLAVSAIPLAIPPLRLVRRAPLGRELIAALVATGRFQLAYALLLAAGLRVAMSSAVGG